MKKYFFIFSCLISIYTFSIDYEVTSSNLGNSNSIDAILNQAIVDANNGNDVVIKFNVSSGLINITEPLPQIINNSGSIRFERSSSANEDQGFNVIGGDGLVFALYYSSNIEFHGLVFNSTSITASTYTIYSRSGKNINIQDCKFISSFDAIRYGPICSGLISVKIVNNEFIDYKNNGISLSSFEGCSESYEPNNSLIEINNNLFSNSSQTSTDAISYDAHINQDLNLISLLINGNIINSSGNYGSGISLISDGNPDFNEKLNVSIANNTLDCAWIGLERQDCKTTDVIVGNSFNNSYIGLSNVSYNQNTGVKLVNPNSLGFETVNSGNSFINCINSISVGTFVDLEVQNEIVGNNLDGGISIFSNPNFPNTKSTVVLDNTILLNSNIEPITLSNGANESFDPISLTSAVLNGYDLSVNYSLGGLEVVNSPFLVEFYKSNQNHELLEKIGSTSVNSSGVMTFSAPGVVLSPGGLIGVTINSLGDDNNSIGERLGSSPAHFISPTLIDPTPVPDSCACETFKPIQGKRYWLSAWVKENHLNQVKSYDDAFVELEFEGGYSTIAFHASGEIIDGWQRIVGDFVVPNGTYNLRIHFANDNGTVEANFDDIRIHPFNASMKSYVYDPETFWLRAELDDNNYATFYEYDQEGGLVRIKKETARGIVTIQETRSNSIKKED